MNISLLFQKRLMVQSLCDFAGHYIYFGNINDGEYTRIFYECRHDRSKAGPL